MSSPLVPYVQLQNWGHCEYFVRLMEGYRKHASEILGSQPGAWQMLKTITVIVFYFYPFSSCLKDSGGRERRGREKEKERDCICSMTPDMPATTRAGPG